MVAYNFKKRFGPPILAGTKAQTIRADCKRLMAERSRRVMRRHPVAAQPARGADRFYLASFNDSTPKMERYRRCEFFCQRNKRSP